MPRPALRAVAALARPLRPAISRQMRAAVVMDTADLAFDAAPARATWPEIPITPLADVLSRAPVAV